MKRQRICQPRLHLEGMNVQRMMLSAPGLRMLLLAATLGVTGCGASLNDGKPAALLDGPASEPFHAAAAATPSTTSDTPTTTSAAPAALSKVAQDLTAGSKPGTGAYKIGPLDVLEVSVFKVPDLSKTVQVADSGTVNLPLVGEVPAAGRTAQDVERDLAKKLGAKYLQNPQVNVFVKEYNSQRVTIDGAVKKPGVFPIKGRSTLLQMIASAEGLTEVANSEVVIFRETDGKRAAAKFNIDTIRSGDAEDPALMQGDTIVVGTSALAQSYQNLLKAVPLGSFALLL